MYYLVDLYLLVVPEVLVYVMHYLQFVQLLVHVDSFHQVDFLEC